MFCLIYYIICYVLKLIKFNDSFLFLLQALVLGTMSEYSMPFTHAPVIVEMEKALAEDTKHFHNCQWTGPQPRTRQHMAWQRVLKKDLCKIQDIGLSQ